ncbi:hypothetical protein V6N13_124170 [Hibiscus sabdariffa]
MSAPQHSRPRNGGRRLWDHVHLGSVSAESLKGHWQVCDPHGKAADVFIPAKREMNGSRFRFVRMESERDAYRVIKRLNDAWIYGVQIRVSMAKRECRDMYWRQKKKQDIDRSNEKRESLFESMKHN